jgi:hypothetical protein
LRKLADVALTYWLSARWAVMHCGLDVPINLLKLIGHSVAKIREKEVGSNLMARAMYLLHEESTWRNVLSAFGGV